MKSIGVTSSIVRLTMFFLILCTALINAERVKPRVIATTDGEIDDLSTMVRFLLYSCDFDVAGIIQNNSVFQRSGHSKDKADKLRGHSAKGPWFPVMMDAYKSIVPQLKKHNPDYPTAEYLTSVMRVGNENPSDIPDRNARPYKPKDPSTHKTKNTEGEQLIVKVLTDDDPRGVHISCWGGANTVAAALWTIKNSKELTPEQIKKALSKAHIYCIWYQDGGGSWIEENVKEATIWEAYGWHKTWDYGSLKGNPKEVAAYMTEAWMKENQINNHGPLAALTPQGYVSEGDTPSWLHMINNGLEAHVDYTLGGWGGRPICASPDTKPNYLQDDLGCHSYPGCHSKQAIKDDGVVQKANWRWTIAAQNDFAARLDWCVKEYAEANHAPIAAFNGTTVNDGPPILRLEAIPGQTVSLDAAGSTDPDKHTLSYKWWVYKEAGTYGRDVEIKDAATQKASITVPADALGKTIQVLIEVTDNGEPPLKNWRRAMIEVKSVTDINKNRLQGSMKSMVIRSSKTTANGLTTVSLPKQFGTDSRITLYSISGKSIPFAILPSKANRTITYRSNGIAFIKVITKQETAVFKVLQ